MSIVAEIFTFAAGILISVFAAFVLVYFVGIRTSVIGVSMEPALYNGQEVLINRFAYKLANPTAGDVIVFLPNGNENAHYYVKRVVATPGDTVEFRDGRLYVNGVMEENDEYDKVADPGIAEEPLVVGEDEFFVLGDNRNNSEDSRSGNIGLVKRELIEGRVWFHLGHANEGIGFVE